MTETAIAKKTDGEKKPKKPENAVQLWTPDQVVIARDHAELETAQKHMIELADQKLKAAEADLADIEENIAVAKKNKWRVNAWRSRKTVAKKRIVYYEKVKAALKAGFILVPNFPVVVFAIRTSRKKPTRNLRTSKGKHDSTWVPDQETNSPPVGEGEFVDLTPFTHHWTEKETDDEGNEVIRHYRESTEFDTLDFPMAAVKPQIIEATTRAAQLRIFDKLGVLPQRTRRGGGDPMVVGQIVMKNGYSERTCTFLVAWWISPEDL